MGVIVSPVDYHKANEGYGGNRDKDGEDIGDGRQGDYAAVVEAHKRGAEAGGTAPQSCQCFFPQ